MKRITLLGGKATTVRTSRLDEVPDRNAPPGTAPHIPPAGETLHTAVPESVLLMLMKLYDDADLLAVASEARRLADVKAGIEKDVPLLERVLRMLGQLDEAELRAVARDARGMAEAELPEGGA